MRSSAESIRFGALALQPGGSGVQTYARELLKAIAPRLSEYSLSALVQSDAVGELPPGVHAQTVGTSSGARRAVQGLIPRRGADLFHSLDVDLPLSGPGAMVATVHDLSVFDVPWAFGKVRAKGERALLRGSFRRADKLIADSEFTAERIHDLFGLDADVTHLAPAPWATAPSDDAVEVARSKYDLPSEFLLQVGTVEPRKDVALVASAASTLGIPFVLAGGGSTGPNAPAGSLGLGYVPTADLPALYRAATITTYASKYEGFGLPPVEAMACGGAVVASSVGALPQVVGDGAILVARHNVDAWVAALRPLVSSARDRDFLRERGIAAAAKLTWEDTATATIDVYRSLGVL
ncbi:glycosyltransferase family 4 protein [Actinomycetes bacterium M1A6_2h]